jgi:hypothetical protein
MVSCKVETWNDNPRSFTWTKTAEEILDSLARYLARISPQASQKENEIMSRTSGAEH